MGEGLWPSKSLRRIRLIRQSAGTGNIKPERPEFLLRYPPFNFDDPEVAPSGIRRLDQSTRWHCDFGLFAPFALPADLRKFVIDAYPIGGWHPTRMASEIAPESQSSKLGPQAASDQPEATGPRCQSIRHPSTKVSRSALLSPPTA